MDVDSITQRLKQRREQAGYSQEALAEKLGVSRQAVAQWERPESPPDTYSLILLAQFYGISIDNLVYDDPLTASEETHASWDDIHSDDANSVSGDDYEHGPHGDSEDGASENGEHFDSWKDESDSHHLDNQKDEHDANRFDDQKDEHDANRFDDQKDERDANRFDDQKDERGANRFDGKSSGKSAFKKSWERFPYPLLVVVAFFVLGGFGICPWGPLFFLFFTIPLYYVIGAAIKLENKSILVFGSLPIVALAAFCYAIFFLC